MQIEDEVVRRYLCVVRSLSVEDGGGFLAEFPELPGCYSDGETVEEARANGLDAGRSYLLSCALHGDEVPLGEAQDDESGMVLMDGLWVYGRGSALPQGFLEGAVKRSRAERDRHLMGGLAPAAE